MASDARSGATSSRTVCCPSRPMGERPEVTTSTEPSWTPSRTHWAPSTSIFSKSTLSTTSRMRTVPSKVSRSLPNPTCLWSAPRSMIPNFRATWKSCHRRMGLLRSTSRMNSGSDPGSRLLIISTTEPPVTLLGISRKMR